MVTIPYILFKAWTFFFLPSHILNENLLPIVNPQKQGKFSLNSCVINSQFQTCYNSWQHHLATVTGELLTHWHPDNASSVRAVPLLSCLLLCLPLSFTLYLSVCVSPWSFCSSRLFLSLRACPSSFLLRLQASLSSPSCTCAASLLHSKAPHDVNVWWPRWGEMTAPSSTHTESTLRREREIGGKWATAVGMGRREKRQDTED